MPRYSSPFQYFRLWRLSLPGTLKLEISYWKSPASLQRLAGGQVQVGGLVVAGQAKSLSLLKKPGARLNFQKIGADVGHARVTAKSHRFPHGIGGLALQAQHQVQPSTLRKPAR